MFMGKSSLEGDEKGSRGGVIHRHIVLMPMKLCCFAESGAESAFLGG